MAWRFANRVFASLLLVACTDRVDDHRGEPAATAPGSTSEGMGETEAAGGSSTGEVPPPELGEVEVDCDGAVRRSECTLRAEEDTPCTVACELPSPCEEVVCSYDVAYDMRCASLETPDALQCVFDALREGGPVRLELRESNTYPFVGESSEFTIWRVADEAQMVRHHYRYANDTGDRSRWTRIGAHAYDRDALDSCEATASGAQRFNCLVDALTASCAELEGLACP